MYSDRSRSVEDQWDLATAIARQALIEGNDGKEVKQIFVGDVFFIAIMRQKMLISCYPEDMAFLDHIYSDKKLGGNIKFIFVNFMCTPYWWQGVLLCPNLDIARSYHYNGSFLCDRSPAPFSVSTPKAPKAQRLRESADSIDSTDAIPTILSLEPQHATESKENYLEKLSELIVLSGSDLIVLFGAEQLHNGSKVKLSPLVSIPHQTAVSASLLMPSLGRRYYPLIQETGDPDLNRWGGLKQVWFDLPQRLDDGMPLKRDCRPNSKISRMAGGSSNGGGTYFPGKPGRLSWRYSPTVSTPDPLPSPFLNHSPNAPHPAPDQQPLTFVSIEGLSSENSGTENFTVHINRCLGYPPSNDSKIVVTPNQTRAFSHRIGKKKRQKKES